MERNFGRTKVPELQKILKSAGIIVANTRCGIIVEQGTDNGTIPGLLVQVGPDN